MAKETLDTLIKDFEISTRTKNALIKHGWKTAKDLSEIFKEDLQKVKGLGQLGQDEISIYLRSRHKISLKKKPKAKDPNFSLKKELIEKLIKPEHYKNYDVNIRNRVWAESMTALKQLFNKYPEIEFWKQFELKFKLNSLRFFFTSDGSKILESELKKWKLANKLLSEDKEKEVELSTEKIGEDYNSASRPMSLKDFLKK